MSMSSILNTKDGEIDSPKLIKCETCLKSYRLKYFELVLKVLE